MWNSNATFSRILEFLSSFKRVFICTLPSRIKTLPSIPPIGLQKLIEFAPAQGSGGAKQTKTFTALYFRLPFVRIKTTRGIHKRIILVNYLVVKSFERSSGCQVPDNIGYDFRKGNKTKWSEKLK